MYNFGNNDKDSQRFRNSIMFGAPATDEEMGEVGCITIVVLFVVAVIGGIIWLFVK